MTLIVNPFASRVTESGVRALESKIRSVETLLTERQGHATELARHAQGEVVFVFGGDGVVNEVLNGLPDGKAARDRPRRIHERPRPRPRCSARPRGRRLRERRISLGRVNGRRFAFSAGIGVDSETVRELETHKRRRDGRRPGDLAYARAVARRLLRGYEPRLDVEGLGRAALLFVSNDAVFTYAGPRPLRFSPAARFELGLDVVAPERAGALASARYVARIAAGRGLAGAPGVLAAHDVERVRVTCDEPLPLEADGEDLGDVTDALFEAERDAVSVLVA